MAVDLHPDIVAAIREFNQTRLGRRYDRFARRRYGVSGAILLGKTNAGEAGGRSNRGRAIVSSAGARGSMQFMPATRQEMIDKHGLDPWGSDAAAVRAAARYHLERGVEGYNPGMPTYKDYILGQKLNPADRRALRSGNPGGSAGGGTLELQGPQRTRVVPQTRTIPGQSFAAEREASRRSLLEGGLTMDRLLEYKASVNSMQDVPERKVRSFKVERRQGQNVNVPIRGRDADSVAPSGKGGIYEVFYDPMGEYWDSGALHKGAIGGHGDHVHVSGDRAYVERLGRFAQSMGLQVGEQRAFGGTPTGGHTEGSFHYTDRAIDVSGGTPAKRRKFARIVLREARRGRGR